MVFHMAMWMQRQMETENVQVDKLKEQTAHDISRFHREGMERQSLPETKTTLTEDIIKQRWL